ncbi:MAG: polysialyltransferase family glycosyltransferase, partial [Oceanobacter sp.]
VHAAFPTHVHPLLKGKLIRAINPAGFESEALRQFSDTLMNHYGFDSTELSSLNSLFTLPHESLFERQSDYKKQVLDEIKSRALGGQRVAAKYHPRNSEPDMLNLQAEGVTLLPAGISFEAMLPHFPKGMEVIGDVSSTLLTARWLRRDLQVTSIWNSKNVTLDALFTEIGIKRRGQAN